MLVDFRDGTVEPDYFQFYLSTATGEHASDKVTSAGYEAHLEAASQGFIYVGTLKKFKTTQVRLEVHDEEPENPTAQWQHVAEVSFLGDGELHVLNWSGDSSFSTATPVRPLRLRASWTGLETNLSEGLRQDGTSAEQLLLQIWPAPAEERRVIRWWSEWELAPPTDVAPDGRRQIDGLERVMEALTSGLRRVPVDLVGGYGHRPPMPGGGRGQCVGIYGDPRDGSWWIDGYDVRRTLRTASSDEVRALLPFTRPTALKYSFPGSPDPRWTAMLESIGLGGQ